MYITGQRLTVEKWSSIIAEDGTGLVAAVASLSPSSPVWRARSQGTKEN